MGRGIGTGGRTLFEKEVAKRAKKAYVHWKARGLPIIPCEASDLDTVLDVHSGLDLTDA